jgi:hypothetical protein
MFIYYQFIFLQDDKGALFLKNNISDSPSQILLAFVGVFTNKTDGILLMKTPIKAEITIKNLSLSSCKDLANYLPKMTNLIFVVKSLQDDKGKLFLKT